MVKESLRKSRKVLEGLGLREGLFHKVDGSGFAIVPRFKEEEGGDGRRCGWR